MQPSWISVDFDNWRDWENEEDEGKEEYDRYVDVSTCNESSRDHIMFKYFREYICYFAIDLFT